MLKINLSFRWEYDRSSFEAFHGGFYEVSPETTAYINSPQFERYYRDYMVMGKKKDYIMSVFKTVPALHIIDHNWDVYRGRPYSVVHLLLACNHPDKLRSALEQIMEQIGGIGSVTMWWKNKKWKCYTYKSLSGFEKDTVLEEVTE